MIAGRIDFICEQISTALPQIEGKMREGDRDLGSGSRAGLENLPTAKEQGIDGLDCGAWGAFVFPKGTPDAIVQRMARAANETVETPAVRERLKADWRDDTRAGASHASTILPSSFRAKSSAGSRRSRRAA